MQQRGVKRPRSSIESTGGEPTGGAAAANGSMSNTSGTKAVCSCPGGILGDACQFQCPGIGTINHPPCHGYGTCGLVADSQGQPLAAMCTW